MPDTKEMSLIVPRDMRRQIRDFVAGLVTSNIQPSATELLHRLEKELGWAARWELEPTLSAMQSDKNLTRAVRDYLYGLLESDEITKALRGEDVPDRETASSIDTLIQSSQRYRNSEAFQEMITFMARFRDYAPYNNMLVKVQNPACGFYAREKDWYQRFGRRLVEDARPMLILAPMHPVMLVYDIDQTVGDPLPEELTKSATFEGTFEPEWLERMTKNTGSYRIRVDIKTLSSTNSGFATLALGSRDWKMRIALHDGLDGTSRLGVLCHELAHILLGHLGTDRDLWWPCRTNLTRQTVEIEAESVAYIVMSRLGLEGSSAAYVSGCLKGDSLPESVSVDLVAKVAGAVERMARESVPAKKPRL